jgi:tetratricopeptide (TPR) repeat protein
MLNDYRGLWPDIETWAGPQLKQQWASYLNEARARWNAGKTAQSSLDYLSALLAAHHYKTALRKLLPLFDKPDKRQDFDLIFAVNSMAETLARMNRWKDGEELFKRAQAVWPVEENANALNIGANYAVFLLNEGRADEGLKRLDESIDQARKWGPEVGKSAVAAMYHYRACMLHQLGRNSEAGIAMAMAAQEGPASAAGLQLCLDNPQAAKKALIAGLDKEDMRDAIVGFVQLPSEEPLPSAYSRKMRERVDALRTDPELLRAVAKYGRVIPWTENAGAPPEIAAE